MPSITTRIWVRRAYEDPTTNDGQRLLVDRIWPRGISREALRIEEWVRDSAPSDDLRRWFDHDPRRWEGFVERYEAELTSRPDVVEALVERARSGRVTLVYGAGDERHNNAVALGHFLAARID